MASKSRTRFTPPDDDYELAADVEEKNIRWLIEQRLAMGVLTLIAGRPGQGKSLFTAWLTAHITQGGGRVIFSNLEDLKGETTRPRLRVAGADLSKVSFWTPDMGTPEGLAKLEAVVKALDVKVLILDPISGHLTRQMMDSRVALNPIKDLCERTGLCIIAIHHTRKSLPKKAHPLDWVKGAGDGLQAASRMVYVFGKNSEDPDERLLVHAKSNISQEGSMTFAFDMAETEVAGKETEIARLLLIDPLSEEDPQKIADSRPGAGGGEQADGTKKAVAADWLTSLLMFGEMHADEVKKQAEDAGLAWRTIRRALKELGCLKREAPRGYGKGRDYWWRLPDDHPALKLGKRARAKMDAPGDLTVEQILAEIEGGAGADS